MENGLFKARNGENAQKSEVLQSDFGNTIRSQVISDGNLLWGQLVSNCRYRRYAEIERIFHNRGRYVVV